MRVAAPATAALGALGAIAIAGAGQAPDARSAWTAAGSPSTGAVETGGWVFAGHRQPADPASRGFEAVELAGCKQEAMVLLVDHCTGSGEVAPGIHSSISPAVESAFRSWYSGKVQTAGATWVETRRADGHDVAVVALPIDACRGMPKRREWRANALDVAAAAESWLIAAALAEVLEPERRDEAVALASSRLRASVAAPGPTWPAAWLRLPGPITAGTTDALGIGELAKLCAMRPGDRALWRVLADRCRGTGLARAAAAVGQLPDDLDWPKPADIGGTGGWAAIEAGDLPPALVAVLRSGGAIPAKPAPEGESDRAAAAGFFAIAPDLALAETKAREACAVPSPGSLNILAAIRLADARATTRELLEALAFATQSAAIQPEHPYAAVNALRALQRLGRREAAAEALKALPTARPGSWQAREVAKVRNWIEAR